MSTFWESFPIFKAIRTRFKVRLKANLAQPDLKRSISVMGKFSLRVSWHPLQMTRHVIVVGMGGRLYFYATHWKKWHMHRTMLRALLRCMRTWPENDRNRTISSYAALCRWHSILLWIILKQSGVCPGLILKASAGELKQHPHSIDFSA